MCHEAERGGVYILQDLAEEKHIAVVFTIAVSQILEVARIGFAQRLTSEIYIVARDGVFAVEHLRLTLHENHGGEQQRAEAYQYLFHHHVCFMKSSVVFVAKIRISLWFALFKSVFCDFIGKDISFFIVFTSVKVFVLFYFVVHFWSG